MLSTTNRDLWLWDVHTSSRSSRLRQLTIHYQKTALKSATRTLSGLSQQMSACHDKILQLKLLVAIWKLCVFATTAGTTMNLQTTSWTTREAGWPTELRCCYAARLCPNVKFKKFAKNFKIKILKMFHSFVRIGT